MNEKRTKQKKTTLESKSVKKIGKKHSIKQASTKKKNNLSVSPQAKRINNKVAISNSDSAQIQVLGYETKNSPVKAILEHNLEVNKIEFDYLERLKTLVNANDLETIDELFDEALKELQSAKNDLTRQLETIGIVDIR